MWTAAKWIREFVKGSEGYKKDSVVGSEVEFELVKAAERITEFEGRDGMGVEGRRGWRK